MAWNEPGGNDQKDPWGNDQGPPDLDEAFRRLKDKLGGGMGGGGSGPQLPLNRSVLTLLFSLVAMIWAYMGINVVDEQELGVVLRLGRFHEVIEPGFNWNPAIVDEVTLVNVTAERQYTSEGLMLTRDENIVELPLTVHYNIANVQDFVLKVDEPEISLREATDSALRHVVGSTELNMALSEGRDQIGDDVRVRLQSYLDRYGSGIQIVKVNIQKGEPPAEVKAAFDDVIKAKEDELRLKEQAQSYANSIIPEARGRAQRVLEEAEAYRAKVEAEAVGEAERFEKLLAEYKKAPEVTRERLYLATLEKVMSSVSKVMVGSEAGGNNILYLPLDKIISQSSRGVTQRSSVATDDAIQRAADEVIARLRRESANARTRESR